MIAPISGGAVAWRRLGDPRILVVGAVVASWALALGLTAAGRTDLISHDTIMENETLPLAFAIVAFVVTWQLMTGAMMLPTTLPIVAVYARVAGARPDARLAFGVFLAAYFAVWTGFAAAALAGDSAIHWAVGHWTWLDERPSLITGSLLLGAGAFQLTPLKERCLTGCRNPVQFVWSRYSPGIRGAWRLGVAHGMFCLGCCWALMLVMFGLGVGSITVMAAVSGVMVLEKSWSRGANLVRVVSGLMIGLGALTIVVPDWLRTLPALP